MNREPTPAPVTRSISDRFRLRWDIFQFFVLVLATMPQVTGTPLHEWLGVAIIPILVIHLLGNWNWIVSTTRRVFQRLPGETRFNHIWNALLFVVMTLVILSGILISENVVRFLGIPIKPDPFWRGIHESSASLLVVMIGVHLALHARWMLSFWRSPRPAASPPAQEDPS